MPKDRTELIETGHGITRPEFRSKHAAGNEAVARSRGGPYVANLLFPEPRKCHAFASTVAGPAIRVFGCHVYSCRLQLASTNRVHRIRCSILDGIGSSRTAQICRRACIGF